MLIAAPTTLLEIQNAIAMASHGLVDQNGQRVTIGTIDDRRLTMAAHIALQIAIGDVVWPADKQIEPPAPVRGSGPFRNWGQ